MLNMRPLTISDHPAVRSMIEKSERVITPLDLHYGRSMGKTPMGKLLAGLNSKDKEVFENKWEKIISKIDEAENEKMEKLNEGFRKRPGYEVGDLVYLENNQRHKESLRFVRNLFVIIENDTKKYKLQPLFGNKNGGLIVAHANDLKTYNYSHLLNLLPPELKALMGQNYSPEELKEMVQKDPKFIPDDLVPRQVLEGMQLRNRLSPRSLTSIPAILSSDTSYLSDVFRYVGDDWSEDEGFDDEPESRIGEAEENQQHRSVSQHGNKTMVQENPIEFREVTAPSDEGSQLSPIRGPGSGSHMMETLQQEADIESGSPKFRKSPGMTSSSTAGNRSARSEPEDVDKIEVEASVYEEDTGRDKPERHPKSLSRLESGPGIIEVTPKKLTSPLGIAQESVKRWLKKTFSPLSDKLYGEKSTHKSSTKGEISIVGELPRTIVYEASEKPKSKKRGVSFGIGSLLKEQVTRYGRKTKIPQRYLD
jgi:hypothetical protein